MIPADAPARSDYLLAGMGVALLGGFAVGLLSAVPLGVAGGAGSLVASLGLAVGLIRPPG
ncbi:MAG: hypothetical protein ABEH40_04220 [Haloferacaceae archaeon]